MTTIQTTTTTTQQQTNQVVASTSLFQLLHNKGYVTDFNSIKEVDVYVGTSKKAESIATYMAIEYGDSAEPSTYNPGFVTLKPNSIFDVERFIMHLNHAEIEYGTTTKTPTHTTPTTTTRRTMRRRTTPPQTFGVTRKTTTGEGTTVPTSKRSATTGK